MLEKQLYVHNSTYGLSTASFFMVQHLNPRILGPLAPFNLLLEDLEAMEEVNFAGI
jgi:hypothetical protein